MSVTRNTTAADADAVIRLDRALFEKVVSGEANAMSAVLRGELGVEGRIDLLVVFQRLFPGPPQRRTS